MNDELGGNNSVPGLSIVKEGSSKEPHPSEEDHSKILLEEVRNYRERKIAGDATYQELMKLLDDVESHLEGQGHEDPEQDISDDTDPALVDFLEGIEKSLGLTAENANDGPRAPLERLAKIADELCEIADTASNIFDLFDFENTNETLSLRLEETEEILKNEPLAAKETADEIADLIDLSVLNARDEKIRAILILLVERLKSYNPRAEISLTDYARFTILCA